jgi:hypothetical protein
MDVLTRYRSLATGRYVPTEWAMAHPDTTVPETKLHEVHRTPMAAASSAAAATGRCESDPDVEGPEHGSTEG